VSNIFDDMRERINQARAVQRAADVAATDMVKLLAGRLRHAETDWGTRRALGKLKKELKDFDLRSMNWVER
jgi:hypothetical protein